MPEAPDNFLLLTPEGKGIIGDLDSTGVLTFAVEAGEGSSVRGTELFNRMLDHFGARVCAIHGVWRKGPAGHPSTNIDKVNELTAAGVRLEEAILCTWTVTRASKRGYTKVQVVGRPDGVAGAYSKIDVLIEKSESA